jgi:toxin YhaV
LSTDQPLVINEWTIFTHSVFLNQFEQLLSAVELLRQSDPQNYQRKNVVKRFAAIVKLVFEVVPQDPTRNEYRQGATLGDEYKHWFRAKFFQQYRLFFRYHLERKIIVFAWFNDEDSKRAYSSKTDAYRVFKKMLENNCPPDDWDLLLKEAEAESNRLQQNYKRLEDEN